MKREPLIIIQARLNSTRYPKKVLSLLDGIPLIVYQYQRIFKNIPTGNIVVAIPNTSDNHALNDLLCLHNIPVFRGHPTNVLKRYIQCANYYDSNIIIRVNGDCPLISPSSIINTLETFTQSPSCDYASTILDNSFPLGEHCECFDLDTLVYAYDNFNPSIKECEHVTPVLYNNRNFFKCIPVKNSSLIPFNLNIRLCIDYPEDLLFIESLLRRLPRNSFDLADIVEAIDKEPHLVNINSQYMKEKTV